MLAPFRLLSALLVLSFGCGKEPPTVAQGGRGGKLAADRSKREHKAESAPVGAVESKAVESKAVETKAVKPGDQKAKAEALAHELLILDGHIDVPWRLDEGRDDQGKVTEDLTRRTEGGHFDLPRARAGGLDAPFMSIYVPSRYEGKGAKAVADRLIDTVEALVAAAPERLALARSAAEVRQNFAAGKISLPLGMENGSPIEGELGNVAYFHGRGIRYITLAHAKDNHLSDSSYDTRHTHGGLSAFGKEVVAEMNRVGIMVDVSHLSDAAFNDVLEVSKVPVIASHSSCRHFTPGWERNMSDPMIKALAKAGGVIQINFGTIFVDDEARKQGEAQRGEIKRLLKQKGLKFRQPQAKTVVDAYRDEHPLRKVPLERVVEHIDHVVKLAGIDHVGLGSDFDGVEGLPEGLGDVSSYPNLIRVLLERGYTREQLKKICSGNVLRVWQAVEEFATQG